VAYGDNGPLFIRSYWAPWAGLRLTMVLCLRLYWAELKLTMVFVSGLKVRKGFVSVIGEASDKETKGSYRPDPLSSPRPPLSPSCISC